MTNKITCDHTAMLPVRIYNHFLLGLKRDIQDHEAYFPERVGDVGLWTVERLPKIIWKSLKDPKVATVTLTALALLGNSSLFYRKETGHYIRLAIQKLPLPKFWQVKFATYLYTCGLILSASMRAFGRFRNPELMKTFYQ